MKVRILSGAFKRLEKLVIKGGFPLRGTIKISGSKNSALPLMAAALLTEEPVIIDNVPQLKDVDTMIELLKNIGVEVQRKGEQIEIKSSDELNLEAPYDIVKKMRASYYVLGPLLGRFRRCKLSIPGGCAIGPRPIDLHIKGMQKLGADISVEKGYIITKAKKLKGSEILLTGPKGSSVGATINVMMAAVMAEGKTTILGAAKEPEVETVAKFLKSMGAKIKNDGSSKIEIEGVKRLHTTKFTNINDRIEAGTYAVAAAITRGEVKLEGAPSNHMQAVLEELKKAGVTIILEKDGIRVKLSHPPAPLHISTQPYPGFPTDMQAQFMAFLSLANGTSTIIENIFENRFLQAMELIRMGADITIEKNNKAIIKGVKKLIGAKVMASDLRASAALVIAGLAAEGTTEISRIYHLDRGYENLHQKLKEVGAKIERVKAESD